MNRTQEILNNAIIKDQVLTLNCGDLAREEYIKVKNVLERLHGKWTKKSQGFLFTYDPSSAISAYVETATLPTKNELSFFQTPDMIVNDILKDLTFGYSYTPETFLEPSAGHGAISDRIKKEFHECKIDLVEMSEWNVSVLESKNYKKIMKQDFLTYQPNREYDLIVMNPPFNMPGLKNCYIDHLYHAYDLLSNNGELYCVLPLNWLHNSTKKFKKFREWMSGHVNTAWRYPGGEFKAQGTLIPTMVVRLRCKNDSDSDWKTLNMQRFRFFYYGDYGYEFYRRNPENIQLPAEDYVKAMYELAFKNEYNELLDVSFMSEYVNECKQLDEDFPL